MPKKRKVLLTVNNNRLSGIENYAFLLAENIDKKLYDVTIGVPQEGTYTDLLSSRNINWFNFENGQAGRFTLKGILNLARHMLSERYNIVHAQAGIPPCIIGSLIGTSLRIEHKHGLDFTTEQVERMGIFSKTYEWMKGRFVDMTIAECEHDKEVLVSQFGFNPGKVKILSNGIENLPPVKKSRDGSKFVVGTIGRLTFQKSQDYLIRAAELLSGEIENIEFHIYGDGENKDTYSDLIKELDLEQKVFLKGYSTETSMTMSTLDIFVLPSRYEGMPYVILEAMRNELPIIATDVGGVSEMISNGVSGILIKKENADELADSIRKLYRDEMLRRELSSRARIEFLEKYTIDRCIKEIEAVYST